MARAPRKKSTKTKAVAEVLISEYERQKVRVAARHTKASQLAREIGPLPKVKQPKRKAQAEHDLRFFLQTYFPGRFKLSFSDDFLKAIAICEQIVNEGGQFALAMPRGSGKSSLFIGACLWALLYGKRRYVVIISANDTKSSKTLSEIKTELTVNDVLNEDFPEVTFPIRKVNGIGSRLAGQTYRGVHTKMEWNANAISLPIIKGSKASSGLVNCCGLTGSGIRGLTTTRACDGEVARPEIVLLDDPQDDLSSRSPAQCQTRLDIINGAVLHQGGPTDKLAILAAVTAINRNDLADVLVDRKKSPAWQGQRFKFIYRWPTNTAQWDRYAELWQSGLEAGNGITEATEFYRANREAMDAGAVVAWPDRYLHDELSAIQHAYNEKLKNEASFASEYQNEPLSLSGSIADAITAEKLARHFTTDAHRVVPAWATKLVAFCDCQQDCLFYAVAAMADDFRFAIIDYGAYPEQGRRYFTYRQLPKPFRTVFPGLDSNSQLHSGLEALITKLAEGYAREDESVVVPSRILIDRGWQHEIICTVCADHKDLCVPSIGRGIGPEQKPLDQYRKVPGDVTGWNWRVSGVKRDRSLLFDTNSWKTFLAGRFEIEPGAPGSFTVFGRDASGRALPRGYHEMLGDHLVSEYPILTSGYGRTVMVWKLHVGRDNHLLDAVIGCLVAASEQGARVIGHGDPAGDRKVKKVRRRYAATF